MRNSVCLVQFNSPHDCQKAYTECRAGKTYGGQRLHAEYGDDGFNASSYPNQLQAQQYNQHQNYLGAQQPFQQNPPPPASYGGESSGRQADSRAPDASQLPGSGDGFGLTLSNLPYSATEEAIRGEFPEALKVSIEFDARGRSRGVAQLYFATQKQCNDAHFACNYKQLGGRPIRGRIMRDDRSDERQDRDQSNSRDYGGRGGRFGDPDASRRDGGYDSGRRDGGYGSGRRDGGYDSGRRDGGYDSGRRDGGFDSGRRDGGYNSDRRDGSFNSDRRDGGFNSDRRDGGRFQSRGRGRGGGGRGYGDRRDGSFGGSRGRDRSPEPVRGYGNNKGPRITSAVISQPGGRSSGSSSDED